MEDLGDGETGRSSVGGQGKGEFAPEEAAPDDEHSLGALDDLLQMPEVGDIAIRRHVSTRGRGEAGRLLELLWRGARRDKHLFVVDACAIIELDVLVVDIEERRLATLEQHDVGGAGTVDSREVRVLFIEEPEQIGKSP